jgi:hypothetical protein
LKASLEQRGNYRGDDGHLEQRGNQHRGGDGHRPQQQETFQETPIDEHRSKAVELSGFDDKPADFGKISEKAGSSVRN